MAPIPHPLSALSPEETNRARDIVLAAHGGSVLDFRVIYLWEPPKADVTKFLELEHSGKLTASSPRPARCAQAFYDVIGGASKAQYTESIVDLGLGKIVDQKVIGSEHQASLTVYEFETLAQAVERSPLFKEKIAELQLPEGFEVVVEPWPYGAPDAADGDSRFFQALIFARDTRSGNPDSNFYAYPLPLIPVMNAHTKEIVRIDELATGGKGDALQGKTHKPTIVDHCQESEYVPELLPNGTRKDLKPLTVVQPEGPSFSITDGNLIEWQKWRMRVTFNPREGAVVHDVRYDGRPVMYRLSMSDMTVPYADPRPPFHRKQAFDFGDGGLGNAVNNLTLGCDCLGVIKYFDGVLTDAKGSAVETKNVICLHEQDNGINWKHTNWRTGRAVVTRRRELVIQFIITLANYEYIFNFKFDQAAGIVVEARATGIVSVVNIDPGKTAPWGNVVSPGALAQNHQHVFCVRIDPSVDGNENTVVQEESLPLKMDQRTNPNGNLYEVRQTPITTSAGFDAAPMNNRVFKIQNLSKPNPISGKPVGYKITPPATQLLLADPNSVQSKRALFARHHLWVTKYKDHELFAGGRYTLQSKLEVGGVSDAADRNEDVLNQDVVVWSVFGLTHNPRIEDWPVMPVEMLQLHITPSDFFTGNPALDVPSNKDIGSQLTSGNQSCCAEKEAPIKSNL
ncbi:copper amine oxidase [Colletotrichum acutatum]|uniref:Amine oxidase n=1 Tax=Glomerella acutata TaxID=27357 RepID=A0AAD8URW6_GLOAC|nr:copper amine oxidase [Colletotrichum acutatum]KAK1726039.1 copper amine oxidase [Colletotrichum acutatum]